MNSNDSGVVESSSAKLKSNTSHVVDDVLENLFEFKYHNINGLGDKLSHSDIVHDIKKRHLTIFSEAMKGPDFHHEIDGYSIEPLPHSSHGKCKRRVPGGFVIVVKNTIKKNIKVVKNNDHVVWIKISNLIETPANDIFICAVYIPHDKSVLRDLDNDEILSIQNDIEHFSSMGIIYPIGDWNSRTGDLLDFVNCNARHSGHSSHSDGPRRLNIDKKINAHGRKLLNLCKSTGHLIQNGRNNPESTNVYTCYRHNGQSTVDYLLSKKEDAYLLKKFTIHPRTVDSDHCAITFSLPLRAKNKRKNISRKQSRKKRNISKYKFDKSKLPDYHIKLSSSENTQHLDDFLCSIISEDKTHGNVIDDFYDCIIPPIKESFEPVKEQKQNKFPKNDWFDEECKNLKRRVNDKYKENPWCLEVENLKKEYHRVTQQKKRQGRRGVSKKAHDLKVKNSQEFWDFWKAHVTRKPKTNKDISLETFSEHYKDVANNHLTANDENYNHEMMLKIEKLISEVDIDKEINAYIDSPTFDCLNGPIREDEIISALKNTKNKKAVGSDGLASEFFKYSNGILNGPLTALFNFILNSGEYPDQWSEGLINPIHKKKSKADPGNYRKVTVLPALGKLFDTILNSRLTTMKDLLETNDPLQFGFKKKHGSIDNAFILDSIIDISKARGRPTYVCYIDLKSAFDMIIRAALLFKLRRQGIKGKFFSVINSMFKKATSTVKWDGQLGETFENMCGVLQGGVSSPQLFKVFLEDLVKYLDTSYGVKINGKKIAHLLLADDLALISESKYGLQKLIEGFQNFCKQWHLVVNMDKTKFSVFNSNLAHNSDSNPITYNKEEVKQTSDYVYVGINFSTDNKRFASHLDNVAESANKAIFAAMALAKNAIGGEMSALTYLHIFDTQIRPILEYGSVIWFTNKSLEVLEKVQTKFFKRALGVGDSTPHLALYGDTGKFPLLLRQRHAFLKYWVRLTQMPKGSILRDIYEEHMALNTPYMLKVRSALEAAGVIPDELPIVNKDNTNFFLKIIRNNNEFIFKSMWYNEINDSEKNPMLRLYKNFKSEFKPESYIKSISNRRLQKCLSQFRLSSHCLRIHKGRQERDNFGKNTPSNKRFCLSCKSGQIDDELHLLSNCSTHNGERENMFSKIQQYLEPIQIHTLSPLELLNNILNSSNDSVLYEFCKFLSIAFRKRKLEYLSRLGEIVV